MKLVTFIRTHKEDIAQEWIKYATENIECTRKMDVEEIKDHIMQMLDRIAEDMDSSQSDDQQEKKSKGNKEMKPLEIKAAIAHGEQRVSFGFDIIQLSSEFRALRASVLRLWDHKSRTEDWSKDFHDMVRFNEAIDELWMISVQRFQEKLDQSRHWFLGILGHDLRNPITTISAANSILKLSKKLSDREKAIIKHSDSSIKRMTELIDNLLELTELQLGIGMTMNKGKMDLAEQSEKIVEKMKLAYPEANIRLQSEGKLEGQWDALRLEQMMTNLITNAIRHGKPDGEVKVSLSAEENKASFSVHNEGPPIPEALQEKIYKDRFFRNNGNSTNEKNYGLGLFIVKEIVEGHQGEIELTSTKENGTTFTVNLPRN